MACASRSLSRRQQRPRCFEQARNLGRSMQNCLANGVVSVHPPVPQMAQQAASCRRSRADHRRSGSHMQCDGSNYRVWNSRKRIAAPRCRAPNISVASDIELAIIPNSADQQVDGCPWPIIADRSRRPPRSTPRFACTAQKNAIRAARTHKRAHRKSASGADRKTFARSEL